MSKVFLLFIILFYGAASLATHKKSVSNEITFIHLGLIHNSHFDANYHYPPSAIISVVEAIRPDLICGEAVEEKWKANLAGLFPFENRLLEYAGNQIGAPFVPVDWRTTYEEAKDVVTAIKKHMSENTVSGASAERDKLDEDFEKTFSAKVGKDFFHYLHTSFWQDAGYYHTQSERFLGDAPNGFWYRRNANIAFNCYQAAKNAKAKRVLVAYGGEHQYILDSLLKNMPGTKSLSLGNALKLSKISLKPTQLPIQLKDVFKGDLRHLQEYLEKLPKDSSEKIEVEQKRIPGLEKIIGLMFK